MGKIFMQAPQLMLCKPTTNDRWDRRAVELAAYAFHHGTCNVSEVRVQLHCLVSCISSSPRPPTAKQANECLLSRPERHKACKKPSRRTSTTLSMASLMLCSTALICTYPEQCVDSRCKCYAHPTQLLTQHKTPAFELSSSQAVQFAQRHTFPLPAETDPLVIPSYCILCRTFLMNTLSLPRGAMTCTTWGCG